MANTEFGKMMENVRNHFNIKMLRTADKKIVLTHVAKLPFPHEVIFNEDLVDINIHKVTVKLNKSIYIGMCVRARVC